MPYLHKSHDYIYRPFFYSSVEQTPANNLEIIQLSLPQIYEKCISLYALYPNRIIFGISQKEWVLWLEFYIYNNQLCDSIINIWDFFEKVQSIFWAHIYKEQLKKLRKNYFMFSFTLNMQSLEVDDIDIYIKKEMHGEWNCNYRIKKEGLQKRNTYYFSKQSHLQEVLVSIKKVNTHISPSLQKILLFFQQHCHPTGTICIAQKKRSSAIYFSRINYESFLIFLKNFWYPKNTLGFFKKRKKQYKEYLFDIWIDYVLWEKGNIEIGKVSYCLLLWKSSNIQSIWK